MGNPFMTQAQLDAASLFSAEFSELVTYAPYGGAPVADVPAMFTEIHGADAAEDAGDTAVRHASLQVLTTGPMGSASDGDEITRASGERWTIAERTSQTPVTTVYALKSADLLRAGGRQSGRRLG